MTTIIVNDKRMSVAEFQAAHNLTVGGALYLCGTGITEEEFIIVMRHEPYASP